MGKRTLPDRKSIRLKGWDYRNPGLYFITICTKNRQHHFGEINDGIMGLSVPGCVAWHFWREIPGHQPKVVLDEFVVMPNHLHGIVGIKASKEDESVRPRYGDYAVRTLHATSVQHAMSVQNEESSRNKMSEISPKAGSLSAIIRSYKSAITKWCNSNSHEYFAWHPKFYDHIVRNEQSLHRIRKYIYDNPLKWQQDRENMDGNEIHEQAVEYMVAND